MSLYLLDTSALVDFSKELGSYGGGSTWVCGITCEIMQTVGQFPFVREVEIAIAGETDDVLQP